VNELLLPCVETTSVKSHWFLVFIANFKFYDASLSLLIHVSYYSHSLSEQNSNAQLHHDLEAMELLNPSRSDANNSILYLDVHKTFNDCKISTLCLKEK
jgi:hypothetical protein